jgi:hypothetical protein
LQHEAPHPQSNPPHFIERHWQELLLHSGASSGHTFPQPPQLFALVAVFTHVPPQFVWPTGHLHVPEEQMKPVVHFTQAAPQCAASLLVSNWQATVPGFIVPAQSLKPVLHVIPQLPWLQVAVPLVGTSQTVQLVPQCVGSPSVSKHVPPQFVRGEGQAHVLDWQVIPPEQATSQSPQWLSSLVRSEHEPEHSVVPEGHPLLQAEVAPEGAHSGVPESGSQVVVHEPQ